MKRFLIPLVALAVGCHPQPRSVSYFEAHPDETAQVMADCIRGAHRGPECETALAADAALKAKARMEMFRRGFE